MVEKFTFSRGLAKYYRSLATAELKAGFVDAVLGYVFDGVEPDEKSSAYAVFPLVKGSIETSIVRFDLPPSVTYDEARVYAMQDGVPADYLDGWLADMAGRNWEYMSRGNRVKVGKSNFRVALKSFFRQEKRERDRGDQPAGVVYKQEGYDATRFDT